MDSSFSDRFELHRAAAADVADCRAMLSKTSRTFFAASLLLPREVREPATALYAFCRLADDAVDLHGEQATAVAALRERLERLYAGRPIDHPADRAFADVVARFAIPRALPDALLEGFDWDAQSRRYEDIDGVFEYATLEARPRRDGCHRVRASRGCTRAHTADTYARHASCSTIERYFGPPRRPNAHHRPVQPHSHAVRPRDERQCPHAPHRGRRV